MIKKKNRLYIERYSLSLLMFNHEVWGKYYNILTDRMFKSEPHKILFKFLQEHSGRLSYKMLSHELRQRSNAIGSANVVRCQTTYVGLKNFKRDSKDSEYVFKTLVKYNSTEDTFKWMKEYIELVEQGEVEKAEKLKVKNLLYSQSTSDDMGLDKGEIVKDLDSRIKLMKDKIAHPELYRLCKTGIKQIDAAIGGFSPGEFILLAGHTSKGKSTLALNMSYRNHIMGRKVLYFINEMPRIQIETKYDSIVTKIPYKDFKFAKLSDKQLRIWERKIKNLKRFGGEFNVISVSGNCTPNLIREMIKMYDGTDLVIVDSLLYMDSSTKGFNEQGDLGNITRDLKRIAMCYKIPIIGLTQLNVESLDKETLDYSDIGYSRKMSHIADIIIGIPNVQDDDDSVTIQIVKHRDGKNNVFAKVFIDWPINKVLNESANSDSNTSYPEVFES